MAQCTIYFSIFFILIVVREKKVVSFRHHYSYSIEIWHFLMQYDFPPIFKSIVLYAKNRGNVAFLTIYLKILKKIDFIFIFY